MTLSQPLLRGAGRNVNLRYLKIGAINQRISRLVFYQQLISTVYGVARLYWDLVSLRENAAVKRQSLETARKLFDDDKAQVDQGTLAPLELTRAQSLGYVERTGFDSSRGAGATAGSDSEIATGAERQWRMHCWLICRL